MSSKWSEDGNTELCIKSREAAVTYCKRLIDKKYLVGGKKIEMKKTTKEGEDEEEEDEESESEKPKKKIRRFRLDWQPHKTLIDSPDEIYIWCYEVPGKYTFLIGIALVVVIIAFVLQPLWPDSSKMGMWYISMLLIILLGLLIVLYIVRWFLWGIIYTLTNTKVEFWLLPNLDNDKLGVIDSFKPFYSLKFKKKKKSKKQDKQVSESQDSNGEEDKDGKKSKKTD